MPLLFPLSLPVSLSVGLWASVGCLDLARALGVSDGHEAGGFFLTVADFVAVAAVCRREVSVASTLFLYGCKLVYARRCASYRCQSCLRWRCRLLCCLQMVVRKWSTLSSWLRGGLTVAESIVATEECVHGIREGLE